ncbi:MAG TPA: ABC transporter permease, partial [Anaerolineae bacterium]|nr:ABC transporter permease [Anaerolineae bacterium]
MKNLLNAMRVEVKKARRSAVSLVTSIAFLFIPFVGALFMLILKNPEKARNLGILSTKAQLAAVTADWVSYLGFLSQAIAIGGMIIFSFIAAWVFGREYINKTLKDLLALPTSRTTIVMAKFALITVWSFIFSLLVLIVGIALGLTIKLPGGSHQLLLDGSSRFIIASLLAILLAWAVAFVTNISRSYFPALGFVFFMVVLGQIVAALGWGEYFPWAIPALYSNVAGPITLGMASYI